jgi:hypothetical protein
MARNNPFKGISPNKETTVFERTASDTFMITEDKLKLKLSEFENSIKNKSDIFCYLGILITIIFTLATANFKDFILSGVLWNSTAIVALCLFFALTLKALVKYSHNKKDLDSIIKGIKRDN